MVLVGNQSIKEAVLVPSIGGTFIFTKRPAQCVILGAHAAFICLSSLTV